ncbi:unknown [Eubacterium sp. CAG:841]|nr:unknown [Eubacterium sp. CAG:841]
MLVFVFIEFRKQTLVKRFIVKCGLFVDKHFISAASHRTHMCRSRKNNGTAHAEVREKKLAEIFIYYGVFSCIHDFYCDVFKRKSLHAHTQIACARKSDKRRNKLRYRMTERTRHFKAVAGRARHGVRNAAGAEDNAVKVGVAVLFGYNCGYCIVGAFKRSHSLADNSATAVGYPLF